jgi:hypothetical protein
MWRLRSEYGETYVVSFEDGTDVPCGLLSYGDFIYYSDLLKEDRVPKVIIEDEIFKKVVKDQVLVYRLDDLPAGTVPLVVEVILQLSGPPSTDQFNESIAEAREKVSSSVHRLAAIVVQAFPAYKLEDIYAMDYNTFLTRLAQAEQILLSVGAITEPISLIDPKAEQQKRKKFIAPAALKDAWDASARLNEKNNKAASIPPQPSKEELLSKRDKIDFLADNQDLMSSGAISGHDARDQAILQHTMLKKAEKVHASLFKKKG